MTTAAKTAFGTELWMGPAGGMLLMVAELRNVNPPKTTRELLDATTHDSTAGAKEMIAAGTYDPGEVSGSINYIADSTDDVAFIAAATGGARHDFKVVLKKATGTKDRLFSGFVTEYGADDMPVDGLQTASFSIKVSGPVT